MKKLGVTYLFAFFMFSGLIPFSLSVMQTTNISQEVATGIRNGNARDIAKHFGTTVDLKIPGNEGTFSRNQAELILRNFFNRNAPSEFTIQHQGPSRDGSVYVIGNLKTRNGNNYRTYFLIKKISDDMVLHLLQFEVQ
ncbi:MAG: DUF4783 domain-containing protein [Bacteroidales bacterium]